MSAQTTVPSAEPINADGPSPERGQRGVIGRALGSSAGRNLGLVIALLVLFGIGAVTAGERFTNVDNVLTIIRYASIFGVLSIGMTFVIIGGGIDLSVGSVMGLGSVVATLTVIQNLAESTSWIVMVIVAIAVGTLAGIVNGIVISYGNVVAFMATLAMLVAARGFAEILSNRTTQIVRS
ncbi:MAG: ABC transporter permease, partial [Salinibacterium sp.]|nr:ABC transporter permease [Salinibacterium sp.]